MQLFQAIHCIHAGTPVLEHGLSTTVTRAYDIIIYLQEQVHLYSLNLFKEVLFPSLTGLRY